MPDRVKSHVPKWAAFATCVSCAAVAPACGGGLEVEPLGVAAVDGGVKGAGGPDGTAPDVTSYELVDAAVSGLDAAEVELVDAEIGAMDVAVRVTPEVLDAGACPALAPPAAPCGAELCGNGKIDTCAAAGDGEACDGQDLGGASCESLGFPGGTLACNSGCGFDVSGCDDCGTNAKIASCGGVGTPGVGAFAVALAASGSTVALAWLVGTVPEDGTSAQGGLRVGVLGQGLSLQSQVGCIGADDASAVAIAATPSGWLVAAETRGGIELIPLTAAGAPSGSAQLLAGASVPILATNPTGGPLLVWTSSDGDEAFVSPLGEDGSVMSTTLAFTDVVEPQYGSAVYVGDGYLVALRADLGATVLHVGVDGTLGTPHSLGEETEYPKVAWNGSQGSVSYGDFSADGVVMLQEIDGTGAPVGSSTMLGSVQAYYGPSPTASTGTDSVVLLAGYTSETGVSAHLDVTRISSTGATVYPPYVLAAKSSVTALTSAALVASGGDLVAAWVTLPFRVTGADGPVSPTTLGIGRVSP